MKRVGEVALEAEGARLLEHYTRIITLDPWNPRPTVL